MNNEKNKKIEDILNSLDGSQKATVPGFFYTRLKAKMLARHTSGENELEKRINRSWIFRPAYALAILILVLLINAVVILKGNAAAADNNTTDADTMQSIAGDYSLNDNTALYDLNQ